MPRTTSARATRRSPEPEGRIRLPRPWQSGTMTLEESLATRRSCRAYGDAPMTAAQAGQLLWAGQGITGLGGLRTAPSARAIYPLRLYLFAQRITGIPAGVYRYDPDTNELETRSLGDCRERLVRESWNQDWIYDAPAVILFAADYSSMTREFGERSRLYTHFEAGHVAQNICLQATAMGLGSITIGAFEPAALASLAGLRESEEALYMVAAGGKL